VAILTTSRLHEAYPVITVVVPARNEEHYLEETLRSLMVQSYPADRMEILVVDGLSQDRTREIARKLALEHPALRLLSNPRRLSAAARNVGIRNARGEVIAILDSHSFVGPDFLATAHRVLEESGADCLGRPIELFVRTDSYLQRTIALARTSWLGHNPVSSRYASVASFADPLSVGVIYRRYVFDRVGLFDETLGACEDVEFNARVKQAGLSTWFEPRLRCTYHPRASLLALYRQLRRYAFFRFRLWRRGLGFHLSQAAPAAALALFAACLVAGVGLRPARLLAGALALGYAATVLAFALSLAARRGLRYLPGLPAAYLAMHMGAAVGFLHGAACDILDRIWAGRRARAAGATQPKQR